VAEAIACGAPVVASDSSSLVELVRDSEARFDPREPASIRATLERALDDEAFLSRLRERQQGTVDTWEDVAGRTVEQYRELDATPRRRRLRQRPRVAYVSPLPPQSSGIADYSFRLLEPLAEPFEVDAFCDPVFGAGKAPAGVRVSATGHFAAVEAIRGGYDHVLICLGNSEHHALSLDLLRRRGGIVLAHDVRLSGLYAFCSDQRPEVEPRPFAKVLRAMYGGALPPGLGEQGWLDPEEADAHRIFMAREAIALSERFFVHSAAAQQLARSDALAVDRRKVEVAPFAFPDPAQFAGARASETPLIGTFGVVAAVKQTAKVLEAFAHVVRERPDCRLAIVGPPAGEADLAPLRARALELGLADRVDVTGRVDGARFLSLIASTTVAVQLRSVTMGENAGSVADCLAAGVPTVATGIGSVSELPDDVVIKVPPDIEAAALARRLVELLDDEPLRRSRRDAGRAFAAERSFARVAEFLHEQLGASATRAA
jgi:glycosyltransferase involved in cell wall biosynthesis